MALAILNQKPTKGNQEPEQAGQESESPGKGAKRGARVGMKSAEHNTRTNDI